MRWFLKEYKLCIENKREEPRRCSMRWFKKKRKASHTYFLPSLVFEGTQISFICYPLYVEGLLPLQGIQERLRALHNLRRSNTRVPSKTNA